MNVQWREARGRFPCFEGSGKIIEIIVAIITDTGTILKTINSLVEEGHLS